MRIAVYGATGNAGTEIVAEAARRGHEVLGLSRHEPATVLPAGVTWRRGDLTDHASVAAVAAEVDAVVTAFGPTREPGGDPSTFAAHILAFLGAVGDTPVLVIGGAGSLVDAGGTRLVDTPDFPEAHKPEALAASAALDRIRAESAAQWTFLSPAPMIGPGARTGTYVIGEDSPVGATISFADFAVAIVDDLEMPAHLRRRWTVASG